MEIYKPWNIYLYIVGTMKCFINKGIQSKFWKLSDISQDVIPNNLGAYIHATHLTTILSIPIVILGLWTDLFSLRKCYAVCGW